MTTAKTPKGRKVTAEITGEYGTARLQAGRIYYGGVALSGWSEGGSGTKSFEEALLHADLVIDRCGMETEDEQKQK